MYHSLCYLGLDVVPLAAAVVSYYISELNKRLLPPGCQFKSSSKISQRLLGTTGNILKLIAKKENVPVVYLLSHVVSRSSTEFYSQCYVIAFHSTFLIASQGLGSGVDISLTLAIMSLYPVRGSMGKGPFESLAEEIP